MSTKAELMAEAVRAAFYVRCMSGMLDQVADSYMVVGKIHIVNDNVFFDVDKYDDAVRIVAVPVVHKGASYPDREAAEKLLEIIVEHTKDNAMLSSTTELVVMTVAEAVALEMSLTAETIKDSLLELAHTDKLTDIVRSQLSNTTGRMTA